MRSYYDQTDMLMMKYYSTEVSKSVVFPVRGHPLIMSHDKGGGGGRRSVSLCDKGGRDPKCCDIAF